MHLNILHDLLLSDCSAPHHSGIIISTLLQSGQNARRPCKLGPSCRVPGPRYEQRERAQPYAVSSLLFGVCLILPSLRFTVGP